MTPSPDMPASGMSAEPVAWQYRRCKTARPGTWEEKWNDPDAWPGPGYWRNMARLHPEEIQVRALYTADSLTQELAAKDKEIAELRAQRDDAIVWRNDYAEKRKVAEAHLAAALAGLDAEGKSNWIARDKLAVLEAQLTALKSLVTEAAKGLQHAFDVAEEAREVWDGAPSDMKAGKLLIALGGNCPGYRADIDNLHDLSRRLNEAVKP